MPRIKKKGKAGQAKNFITRTQAVRKLQVSLPDFRRLCIFKGIYPREPRNKKKASKTSGPNTTFYYSKDIQYLLHEPLLNKFREHKSVSKKIARSLGKGELGDAARLDKIHNKKLALDHIIKERYPTFVDALRDLDDALSLLFLFSSLPSTTTVPAKTIALCQRLCHEFQHYLIVAHALRKSFISIKGIYYQATIQGQDILWLVPHKFVQRVTGDVDFRIMGTFVEFYTTLLGFVNYRLYTTVGLVYPPKFDSKADEEGGDLDAFRIENRGLQNGSKKTVEETDDQADKVPEIDEATQKRVDSLTAQTATVADDTVDASAESNVTEKQQQGADAIDNFEITAKGGDVLAQPSIGASSAGSLFEGLTFYVNRESPRQPLEFLLRAFGSKRIGWDSVLGSGAFSNDELDSSITHQIVDRPPVMAEPNGQTKSGNDDEEEASERPKTFQYGYRVPGRIYVQPQWVWDCVNAGKLLRPDAYAPGELLPPHLSPFVKPKQGAYDPTKTLAEQEREGEVEEFEEAEREARALENGPNGQGEDGEAADELDGEQSDVDEADENGMAIASDDGEDDDDDDNDADENQGQFAGLSDASLSDSGDENEDQDEAAQAAKKHQAELVAEAQGLELTDGQKAGKGITDDDDGERARLIRAVERKRKAEAEERTRRMGMMPRKKKKLYEKMQYGLERDRDEAEKLRSKRRRLEKAKE